MLLLECKGFHFLSFFLFFSFLKCLFHLSLGRGGLGSGCSVAIVFFPSG